MRSAEEIIARLSDPSVQDRAFFGTETSDLLSVLTKDEQVAYKQQLLDMGASLGYESQPRDRESLLKTMLGYMPFAWEKANSYRGLSALRSMSHYMAWTWLAGDDFGDLSDYEFYGKDHLVKICNHYGWDSSQWDDNIRLNEEPDYE